MQRGLRCHQLSLVLTCGSDGNSDYNLQPYLSEPDSKKNCMHFTAPTYIYHLISCIYMWIYKFLMGFSVSR